MIGLPAGTRIWLAAGVTLIAAKAVPGVESKDVKVGTELCWGDKK